MSKCVGGRFVLRYARANPLRQTKITTMGGTIAMLTKDELPECPVATTVQLIGNKWKLLILRNLIYSGKQRFTDFVKSIPGISKKVLTENLRALEDDGLVEREVFAEVPPRVEYSLSDLGKTLKPILDALKDWGADYKSNAENV